MSRRNAKRKSGGGVIALLCLIIIAGLAFLVFLEKDTIKGLVMSTAEEIATAKEIATEQITEQAIEKILREIGDTEASEKAKEIAGSMDEEDKKQVEEIVGKYLTSQTISDVLDMAGEGINEESLEKAKEYLEENVSEEDKEKLWKLYEKYMGNL